MKTLEQIIAEFEKQEAELDAELAKLGIPLEEGYDERAIIASYPPILRATHEIPPEDLLEKIGALIEAGEDVNTASPYGETAIGKCFSDGMFEALRFLVKNGADTDEFSWPDTHKDIAKGDVPTSCDPLERDRAGRAPFLMACRVANLSAAEVLFSETPSEGFQDSGGEGPVTAAVRSHDPKMVAWTLEQGFDVNARSRFGGTALLVAVETDDIEVARYLLKAGADVSLAENVSAMLAEQDKKRSSKKSIFLKAADLIVSKMPAMPDTLSTPASDASSAEIARLLMDHGANILEFESDMIPAVLGADTLAECAVSVEQFNRHGTSRAGTANPEAYLPDFWYEQIRTGRSGYAAEVEIVGERNYSGPHVPVWSFDRFGRTATKLPDGRMVAIAGEHEDYYDSDFCIYADVTVLDGDGGVEHFIYPKDIFPPTDFHTATLVGDHIWLIGSLGYQDSRDPEKTQVLRLNLGDFSIDPIRTTGSNPGWINYHTATLDDTRIVVTGGNTGANSTENHDTFILDLETLVWARAS